MTLEEMGFSTFYRNYLIIEIDELSDLCRDNVKVRNDDCYGLCSCFVNEDGMACFNVLSIGSSREECTRGLKRKDMLAVLPMDIMYMCEAELIKPTLRMMEKNAGFMEKYESEVDDEVMAARYDERLDPLRDIFYPDCVLTGIFHDGRVIEYEMEITGFEGPFIKGRLIENPPKADLNENDPVWALPYFAEDEMRLFAVFAGNDHSAEAAEMRRIIIEELTKEGFSFLGKMPVC